MPKTTLIPPLIPYGRRLMLPAHMATDLIALAILKKIRAGECYTQTDLLQLGFTPEIIGALYEDASKEAFLERSSGAEPALASLSSPPCGRPVPQDKSIGETPVPQAQSVEDTTTDERSVGLRPKGPAAPAALERHQKTDERSVGLANDVSAAPAALERSKNTPLERSKNLNTSRLPATCPHSRREGRKGYSFSHTPDPELLALLKKAKNHTMTAEEVAAQRQSFARGMCTPCDHGILDWETCPTCRNAAAECCGNL